MPKPFQNRRSKPVSVNPRTDNVAEQHTKGTAFPVDIERSQVTNMANEHPYKMSLSLSVLNHLGIGLYSNIPAVLSEVVANAWDADASLVTIDIDKPGKTITICDDGSGMTLEDINERYLLVGYNKRDSEPRRTPLFSRALMGRKGIGKLSVFSIADTVDVYSVKNGQRNAFRMSLPAIKSKIKNNEEGTYFPEPLDTESVDFEKGTRIVLRDLRKSLVATEAHLRRRLARRFSVISAKHGFIVKIGDTEISARDRDFFDKIEFMWFIGENDEEIAAACKNAKNIELLDGDVDPDNRYRITGWIGTVDEQKSIDEENNSIVVLAHGKLIHEDLLKDLKEAGVYARYIIGEIDADFMDLDDLDDIVTSARQSVKEDDERFGALKSFVQSKILKKIQNRWTPLRNRESTKRALRHPSVQAWYDTLGGDNRRSAEQLFAKIETMMVEDQAARKELYKSGILAFERLRLRDSLSMLEKIESDSDFALLAQTFGRIDEIEAAHYYDMAKGRIDVLKKFETLVDSDVREKILQQYIFEHLWLLHPSWERAATNPRIEQSVKKEFADIDANLTPEELAGRIDIRYVTAAGKHIIIELKKYERPVTVDELLTQVRKYRDALVKCLETKFPNEVNIVETILIIGAPPLPHDQRHAQENISLLNTVNARYILYDQLIADAQQSYQDYLAEHRGEMSDLLEIIDHFEERFEIPVDEGTPNEISM